MLQHEFNERHQAELREEETSSGVECLRAIGKKFSKINSLKLLFIDEKKKHKKADGTEVEPLLK